MASLSLRQRVNDILQIQQSQSSASDFKMLDSEFHRHAEQQECSSGIREMVVCVFHIFHGYQSGKIQVLF